MAKKLTIAIPTYNRKKQLDLTILALLPQLNNDVEVKVFDNCSPELYGESLTGDIDNHLNISYFRNDVNYGVSANFIKCFENCDSDWVWVLGDDDFPLSNAVEIIMRTIQMYPELVFINFNSNLSRDIEFVSHNVSNHGQSEFIRNMPSFPNFMFLSSSVYKISTIKICIKSAYYFAPTFAPHSAIILDYLRLNDTAQTMYSYESIVRWKQPSKEHNWDVGLINKSIHDLVYIINNADDRKFLYSKIIKHHPYNAISAFESIKSFALSNSDEEYDIFSDFYASMSFITWASRVSILKTCLKFIIVSIAFFFMNFKIFKNLAKYYFNNNIKQNRSVYNKYLYSLNDKRV